MPKSLPWKIPCLSFRCLFWMQNLTALKWWENNFSVSTKQLATICFLFIHKSLMKIVIQLNGRFNLLTIVFRWLRITTRWSTDWVRLERISPQSHIRVSSVNSAKMWILLSLTNRNRMKICIFIFQRSKFELDQNELEHLALSFAACGSKEEKEIVLIVENICDIFSGSISETDGECHQNIVGFSFRNITQSGKKRLLLDGERKRSDRIE